MGWQAGGGASAAGDSGQYRPSALALYTASYLAHRLPSLLPRQPMLFSYSVAPASKQNPARRTSKARRMSAGAKRPDSAVSQPAPARQRAGMQASASGS